MRTVDNIEKKKILVSFRSQKNYSEKAFRIYRISVEEEKTTIDLGRYQ